MATAAKRKSKRQETKQNTKYKKKKKNRPSQWWFGFKHKACPGNERDNLPFLFISLHFCSNMMRHRSFVKGRKEEKWGRSKRERERESKVMSVIDFHEWRVPR